MLVVAEEKATVALTLVAAHGIDADLLAATIVVLTLIHICKKRKRRGQKSHLELEGRMTALPQTSSPEPSHSAALPSGAQWCPKAVLHRHSTTVLARHSAH